MSSLAVQPDADSALLMNFEISGLPHKTELSYPVFKEVRKKVKDYFGNVCKKKTILTVNPVSCFHRGIFVL